VNAPDGSGSSASVWTQSTELSGSAAAFVLHLSIERSKLSAGRFQPESENHGW
jgi:hypothetical protein